MATSGSTNFATSRDELIEAAMRACGVLDPESGSATAGQLSTGAEVLNMLIKSLASDGMPLWAIKKKTITLTASQANYTVSALSISRPHKIVAAYRTDTSGTTNIDTPMEIITRDEYISRSSKASTGVPLELWYDPQLTNALATIYVYPTPDSTTATNYTITIYYQSPFEDFDAGTDEPDFPQEWYNCVKWKLAEELAFEYTVPGPVLDRIMIKSKMEHDKVLDMGMEEGSVYIVPDLR